jgi:hypothetical protein
VVIFEELTRALVAKAKDDAYLYSADLEISLSRDEIVRLLMTEKLYGHSLRSSFGNILVFGFFYREY